MGTLRRGRETLLTLLEAFVHDPLLDWTSNDTGIIASFYGGGGGGHKARNQSEARSPANAKESRKSMEKKMTHRLLAIRLVENRALIKKNQEQLWQLLGEPFWLFCFLSFLVFLKSFVFSGFFFNHFLIFNRMNI
jgi:phosphatidylinositol kinase/protein kinase (PI-3  family)